MASEKVEAVVEDARKAAVETILEMMESKGLKWVCEWEGAAFMPHNGSTDRRYHGGNRLHLMAKAYRMGYEDSRWFTFKQARELGFGPKKGEKSTVVEYWKMIGGMKNEDGEITFDPEEATERFTYPKLMGYFRVFNAEQLVDKDGNPMPPMPEIEREKPLDEDLMELADKLIESSRCTIEESKMNAQACYSPLLDIVRMPSRTGFQDMEGFITTLTHEMSHSTMKPLQRTEGMGNTFGSEAYAFEELVAELGSTFTCMELGVHRVAELEGDENFANHAAYLQSWLKKFKSDPDYLFKASASAEKAADYLIERYKEHIEKQARVESKHQTLNAVRENAVEKTSDLEFPSLENFEPARVDDARGELRSTWTNGDQFVSIVQIAEESWFVESNLNSCGMHVVYGETLKEALESCLKTNIASQSFAVGHDVCVIIGEDIRIHQDSDMPESFDRAIGKMAEKFAVASASSRKTERETPAAGIKIANPTQTQGRLR